MRRRHDPRTLLHRGRGTAPTGGRRASDVGRSQMRRFRFALAVLGTSVALVVAVAVIGIATAPRVLALAGVGPFGGPFAGAFGDHGLPPELQGMQNLTPAERFGHFGSAQVNLTDKDGKPFVVTITPGKVT